MRDKFNTVGGTITTKEVKDMVRLCMKHLSKKEYELYITKKDIQYAVDILKVCLIKSGASSHGGSDLIKINLAYWQFQKGIQTHTEYKAFNKDKHIGDMQTYNYHQSLLVVVAHEVAHHVQYRKCNFITRYRKTYEKAHGLCFQDVYRTLRKDLVNPMCKEHGFYSDIIVPFEQEPITKKRTSPKQGLIALCEEYDWLEYNNDYGVEWFKCEVWDNRVDEYREYWFDEMTDNSDSWKMSYQYALELIERNNIHGKTYNILEF